MSRYIIAPEVPRDLADIWRHIAEDNPAAADRVLAGIQAAFDNLADLPGMGSRRPDLNNESLRVWPIYSYLIIYRFQAEPLEIVRVLSGYRDFTALSIQ